LKKQSQFDGRQIGVTSFMEVGYDNISACGARNNKNQFLGRQNVVNFYTEEINVDISVCEA